MSAAEFKQTPGRRLFGVCCYHAFLLLFFGGIWMFNTLCFLARPFFRNPGDDARIRKFIQLWMGFYLAMARATGQLKVRYENMDTFSQLRGTVVVANHPGMLDAPLLLSLSSRLVCLYRASLHRTLLASVTARSAGYISNGEGMNSIRKAIRSLRDGNNLLAFPEGTRTVRWPLNPLHKGYALIARKANAPIRILTIDTRSNLLSKARGFLKPPSFPVRVTIRLGPEISPAGFPHVNALDRHVEQTLIQSLGADYAREFTFSTRELPDEEPARYAVTLPNDPAFCAGHFPGRPILPAYAILLFCRHAVLRHRSIRAESWRWEEVRFRRPVLPGAKLTLDMAPGPGCILLTLEENGKRCFSGRFHYNAPKKYADAV